MKAGLLVVSTMLSCGVVALSAQNATPVGSAATVTLPAVTTSYAQYSPPVAGSDLPRQDFLKGFTLESFGYDLSPNSAGFERASFNEGNLTAHGLECPYCTMRPLVTRSRFTLLPFGAQATKHALDGRLATFAGVGGLEAWAPDGVPTTKNRFSSSYNDSWLMQGQVGSRFSVGPGKHLWFGPTARYLNVFGAPAAGARTRWDTLGGSALWRFGHN